MIDTNVFISALMSRRGASFKLLELIGKEYFSVCISVALILEYEEIAKNLLGSRIYLSETDVDDIINYICLVAEHHKIYYLWRPMLKDTDDDMILELALNANCSFIVTYNLADFVGIDHTGIEVITPKTFLERLGVL